MIATSFSHTKYRTADSHTSSGFHTSFKLGRSQTNRFTETITAGLEFDHTFSKQEEKKTGSRQKVEGKIPRRFALIWRHVQYDQLKTLACGRSLRTSSFHACLNDTVRPAVMCCFIHVLQMAVFVKHKSV